MQPASVGFQCPDCIRSGQQSGRSAKTSFGAALTVRGGLVTKVLIGVLIALYVINLISRNLLINLLAMSNAAVAAGQLWRLVTYSFTTLGLLNTAMMCLFLWFVGRTLEGMLGGWRFLVLYVLAGLGGATLLFVIGPPSLAAASGAYAAVIGLLTVHGVIKHKRGEDIRPDIGLLVILVLLNLVIGFGSLVWIGLIGGILVGGLAGVALVYPPRERRDQLQVIGLVGVVVLCAAAVVIKTLVLY